MKKVMVMMMRWLSFEGFVFVHLPLGLPAIRGSTIVEDHGPFQSDLHVAGIGVDETWRPSGFPVPCTRQPVWSSSAGFALFSHHEEEALL